jgi:AraC-like DNA-binding protein
MQRSQTFAPGDSYRATVRAGAEKLGFRRDWLPRGYDELLRLGRSNHAKVLVRFEEYLASRRYQPLYLAEICAAIDVSERMLRACCREHLGMGPLRYLWLQRMHLARQALQQADPLVATVTGIATEHGFWELGRFSVQYRALFGESPSVTLQQTEGRASGRRSGPQRGPSPVPMKALARPSRSASCG